MYTIEMETRSGTQLLGVCEDYNTASLRFDECLRKVVRGTTLQMRKYTPGDEGEGVVVLKYLFSNPFDAEWDQIN